MMDVNFKKRIQSLSKVGLAIQKQDQAAREELCIAAKVRNQWFSPENTNFALDAICKMLETENLTRWASSYSPPSNQRTIGLIMAGNLPFVGFHDLLCCLMMGHNVFIKLSQKDEVLPRFFLGKLEKKAPELYKSVQIKDRLQGFDAVIATGSDNSARYFESYFGKYPHIIRANRTSIAILDGSETEEQLDLLCDDVFRYFGRGCRSISSILISKDYDLNKLTFLSRKYTEIKHHSKYANNYDYQKALFLLNQQEFYDGGHYLLRPETHLHSALSVIHYNYYENQETLAQYMATYEKSIQCIVSKVVQGNKVVDFGQAQSPYLNEYADQIDTMKFLQEL